MKKLVPIMISSLILSVLYGIFTKDFALSSECSESGNYLVCEDWDIGTPPTTPWPQQNGSVWHGWDSVSYGNFGSCGPGVGAVGPPAHSGSRSLLQLKCNGTPDDAKSVVDIAHAISGSPTNIYVRFYLRIPAGEINNMPSTIHLVFINYATVNDATIDIAQCGERTPSGYKDCSSVLSGNHVLTIRGQGATGPFNVANNQGPANQDGGNRDYFILEDHENEWILVEANFDFAGNLANLWINEVQHVTNLSTYFNNISSANRVIISGFVQDSNQNLGAMHFYIDDVVVSTSKIGPRNGSPGGTINLNPPTELEIVEN
jgi:hypothetical protein